ncbi:YceI family protein [Psychromicrobium xiongbiense]|uniref:YceI family protein n=1 Tax=Psychromicrobium xiongbiense TaxID=3051184 RepID=UPI0025534A0C|nr:YceI family protein [Psychromicrobium sp. YIM S02556]
MSIDTIPAGLTTGTWNLDPAHSVVSFTVRHAGISKARGTFADVAATAVVGESLSGSSVQATIQAASVETGNPDRNAHVRSADFFDVEQFPELTFVSTGLVGQGETYDLAGDLTIHGITHPVTFEVEFEGVAVDPFGNTKAGFSAEATISRKDFGLTWNAALEAGGVLVSDKVVISIDAQFTPAQ